MGIIRRTIRENKNRVRAMSKGLEQFGVKDLKTRSASGLT